MQAFTQVSRSYEKWKVLLTKYHADISAICNCLSTYHADIIYTQCVLGLDLLYQHDIGNNGLQI